MAAKKKTTKKKTTKKTASKKTETGMNTSEQIGYHKGCLATLSKERQEFARILSIVEQLMQLHIGALKELGVDLDELQKASVVPVEEKPVMKRNKKPIEDIL